MKPKDFTIDVARKVMELWKEHLGLSYTMSERYFKRPEYLVLDVKNRNFWIGGRFENRIGSRWTMDSKLFMYDNRFGNEGLSIEAYVQAQNLSPEDKKQEAERAEEAFNMAVMEYIKTVNGTEGL